GHARVDGGDGIARWHPVLRRRVDRVSGAGGAGLPSGARIHGDDHRRAMVAGDVTRRGHRACAGGHDERDGQRKAAPQLHVALTDRCSLRRMRSMRAKWMADPPNMTTPIHPHAKSWNTATK